MRKAVFVTDKPSSCLECEFCGYISGIDGIRSCMLLGHHAFANADEEYRICPLKPTPKLKQHADEIDYEYGYIDGWNACIDAIMGETE